MKIIKPLRLGLLHKTYRFKGSNRFVVTPVSFFRLGAKKSEILVENIQWPAVMSSLEEGQVLDMAMPKMSGEVLIAGNAYSPQQKPIQSMNVGFTLGRLKKTLKVTGDREWQWRIAPLYHIDEPKPFSIMPLDYQHAYGGEAYRFNPLGKGHETRFKRILGKRENFSLPNIEYPEKPFKRTNQYIEPASFNALDLAWPQRMRKAGTYDKNWQENEYPGLPGDIDWRIFNAAPEDQQVDGFFNGDEAYQLVGMHPEKNRITGNLPGIKARSFVTKQTTQGLQFEEVLLKLDTVWFFPDKEIGVLLFRGEAQVQDSDGLDVEHIMVAYENLCDTPKDIEHYHHVLKKRTDPKTAVAHVFNESQLSPQKTTTQHALEEAEKTAMRAKELEDKQQTIDETIKEIFSESKLEIPEGFKNPKAEPNPLGMISPEAITRGDFDLSEILQQAEALAADAEAQGKRQAEAMKTEQAKVNAAIQALDLPEENKKETLKEQMQALKEKVMLAPMESVNNRALMEALAVAKTNDKDGEISAGVEEKIQQGLHDSMMQMKMARQVSPKPMEPAKPLPDECKRYLRALVLRLLAEGQSLSHRDLAGADLSALDFSGMELEGVLLENAILKGTKFDDCNLCGAVFSGADISTASFNKAKLEKANFSFTKGKFTQFKSAVLDEAMFVEADISDADFSQASFNRSNLLKAKLFKANFSKCNFSDASFIEAELEGGHWNGSRFEKTMLINAGIENSSFENCFFQRCALINIRADNCRFRYAEMKKVQTGGESSFKFSDFRFAKTTECGWRKVDFEFAHFDEAVMAKSDFGDAHLHMTSLKKTVLYRSVLSGANLTEANLEEADLFEALLRKTNFQHANLKRANLYNADVSEANFEDALLDDIKTLNPIKKRAA